MARPVSNGMKIIFNTIYYLFIIAIIFIALLLLSSLIPLPNNFKVKVVKSGSMEPYIRTGGVVVIAERDSYGLGDVITFGEDTQTQIPTTHRIIDIVDEEGEVLFVTKGDANDSEDPAPVAVSEVKGKVLFTLPYLGYVLDFAKRPIGFVLLVGVPAIIIIIDEIGKILSELKRIKLKKKQAEQEDATSEN